MKARPSDKTDPSNQTSGSRGAARFGRPIFELWPRLRKQVGWVELGDFPTPIHSLSSVVGPDCYAKRDDLSSPIYGGNKVRTLETLFGRALRNDKARIWATGAYGSNHAVATALHAPRVGLRPAAILWPQPYSACADENLHVMLEERRGGRIDLLDIPHWAALPFGMARVSWRDRAADVMPPGGATAVGALGYVSAGIELAQQVAANEVPCPKTVVIGVGSTCTTAGLLVGFRAAAERGLGFEVPPKLLAVRVTPWPITSAYRISQFASRVSAYLAYLSDEPNLAFSRKQLAQGLEVDGTQFGRGYGEPTEKGRAAISRFANNEGGFALDTTYSAKSAAALFGTIARSGPVLYWATKSTQPLPKLTSEAMDEAPRRMLRWLQRGRAEGV